MNRSSRNSRSPIFRSVHRNTLSVTLLSMSALMCACGNEESTSTMDSPMDGSSTGGSAADSSAATSSPTTGSSVDSSSGSSGGVDTGGPPPVMEPVSGIMTAARLKLDGGVLTLSSAETVQGRYTNRSQDPFGSKNDDSSTRRILVRDSKGEVLFRAEAGVPSIIEVPPADPDDVDQTPYGTLEISAMTTMTLPAFSVDTVVEVYEAGASEPTDTIDVPAVPSFMVAAPPPAASESGIFHLHIVASGYDAATMPAFRRKAALIRDYLPTMEPFKSVPPGSLEVHLVENTADLQCVTGCKGITRAICCNDTSVIETASASGSLVDEILVIHNTETYAGSAHLQISNSKTNSYLTYARIYGGELDSDAKWKGLPVALHELGHSAGGLCDEYSYGNDSPKTYECPNCKADCSTWSDTDPACTLGCTSEPNSRRPSDSIMLDISISHFNPPSLDALRQRLSHFGVSSYCTAYMHQDLSISIPALKYSSPDGDVLMWAELAIEPTQDGTIVFQATNSGNVENPGLYAECIPPTLSADLKLNIPFFQYDTSGGASYFWADMSFIEGAPGVKFIVDQYGGL